LTFCNDYNGTLWDQDELCLVIVKGAVMACFWAYTV